MKNELKISIALCTYNGAGFILAQLDSIAAQTQFPDEVIVCDDCSSDGTLEVVSHFAVSAPFLIKYYKNPSQLGVTKNFERAISLCTGDIIFLCDQDDVWLNNKIVMMVSEFHANNQVALVFSNGFITDCNLNQLGYTVWETFGLDKKRQCSLTGANALSLIISRYLITGATIAFRANLKEQFLPIPRVWIHDAWIACIAASQGSFAIVEEPLILYRQHEGNVIGGRRLSFLEKIIKSRQVTSSNFNEEVSRSIVLLNKFQVMTDSKVAVSDLRIIRSKIQHLRAREKIFSSNLAGRIVIVTTELFKLRYFRFSNGLSSVFSDLILRK